MKKVIITAILMTLCFYLPESYCQTAKTNFPEVMFILDASGSMWGNAGGEIKIDAARTVMEEIVPSIPDEVKVGLTVYGHTRKGDCTDIEILVSSGSDNRNLLLDHVNAINPKGKTPIADSVKMVAGTLRNKENETTIVLVSDGEETCDPDPCGVVMSLKQSGIKFILHVIGFSVNEDQQEQLTCLAKAGGGQYLGAENAATLLSAFQSLQEEVVQKVEKAKTATKKTVTKLGKLQISMPDSSRIALNGFKIIRKSDRKIVKTVKDPDAVSTHPLLSGDYEITACYANSNYKDDSEVNFGTWTVKGGETSRIQLGALVINISDELADIPAGAVIITSVEDDSFQLITPHTGNSYYFWKTKPLPAGTYNLSVHYKRMYLYNTSTKPVILAKNISINPGAESVVTIDSGISVKEPADSAVTGWELVQSESATPTIKIEKAFNGSHPLWEKYCFLPGTYDLYVYIEGMDEPMLLGEGLTISPGELIEFDTGL